MKIIHITDFHLVAPDEPLWGHNPHDRLDRCLSDIARWHSDAAFCVMSGDLTNNGDPAAYSWLKERLQSFPLKTFLMVGNHDTRDELLGAFPNVGRDKNGFIQSTHETDHGIFLFLDTLKGPVSEGEYCEARRDWLSQALENAKDKPAWIFMHHPPFDIGLPYMDRIKLEEADKFTEVISAHGNIRHIFFGHVHRAAFINWRGIPCTLLPGTNHQIPLNSESVGGSYSIEPPMYGVVMIDQEKTVVHFDACLDRTPAKMS